MKTIQASLMVALLLLNLFGFYVAYFVRLEGVREEMEETLRSSQPLQVITLNLVEYKQVQWTSPGKECRIKGAMYDVSKVEFLTDEVRLFVWTDEEETTLDNDYVQNFQSKQELPASPVKLFISVIGQDFIAENNKLTVPLPVISTIFLLPGNHNGFAEFIMEKTSPPPWC